MNQRETIKEVYNNIYQIDVPLTGSPLKLLHSYLIIGNDRNLLIDTGFNDDISHKIISGALHGLNISLDNTDILLTHLHADHSGLTPRLKTENNKVFCSKEDGAYLNKEVISDYPEYLAAQSKLMGIPGERILSFDHHPANIHIMKKKIEMTFMKEKDRIKIGDYIFELVDLSGHTPGQLGLYEPGHKIMFCGDHILWGISPNIVLWNENFDSIQVFVDNLKKVRNMDIGILFSSHRSQVMDYKARIDELIHHHEMRLLEILQILKSDHKSIYQTACEMNWDYGGGNFYNFPVEQLWFAACEAFAHMQHLYNKGWVKRWMENGTYLYQLSDKHQEIPSPFF